MRWSCTAKKLARLSMAGSPVNSSRPRLLLLLAAVLPSLAHWHEDWANGQKYNYPWYRQEYVSRINAFYCDTDCDARLARAPTVDREFKAMVDLLNQTTGGPRDVYRGAFEGLDEFKSAGGSVSRRVASRATWKHMEGWDSILTAHTSEETLCTSLKLDGNESFTRQLCYDKILATIDGPLFPSPRCAATPQRPAGAQPARLVVVARRPPRRRSRAPHPPPTDHPYPRAPPRLQVVGRRGLLPQVQPDDRPRRGRLLLDGRVHGGLRGDRRLRLHGAGLHDGHGDGHRRRPLRAHPAHRERRLLVGPRRLADDGAPARPKWPSWWGHIWPPEAHQDQVASQGLGQPRHATPHRSSPVPPRPIIRCRRTCTGSR